MPGGTDRREDEQVPQFYGRIDEKFAEWEIDVRLWQAEFKEEDRDRLGPRLYRRGLHGQPKIIVKTKLGAQGVAQFTVDNIKCLEDNGYGELPEELGLEALDNYFDMRRGKAESIQDYIFREEILTVALQKDTAIDLDEKIRGYWLMRTSNLTEREIFGIKIITQGADTTRASKKKPSPRRLLQRNVRKSGTISVRQETERETALVDTLKPRISICMEKVMMIKLTHTSESESNCSEQWYELDGQEQEALISLRDARKKLQHATKSRRFYPKGGGRGRARNTGKSIDELKKVTTCNRCGANRSLGRKIAHSLPEAARRDLTQQRAKEKSRRFRREKSDGKGRGGSSNYPIVEVYNDGSKNQTSHMKGSSWICGSGLWCCQESVWSETCCSDGTDMCTRR